MLATWQIRDAATAARKRLLAAGFMPIPAAGKAPPMPGWQKLEPTEAEIDSWFQKFPDALNTGVLTRRSPAIDIDVLDPDMAAEIEALAWDMIGSRGMVRFGQAPKRAILFRTSTPYTKISTPSFTSQSQQKHRVEVLGDGQQIVVLGIHPGTRKPYTWHGGELGEIAHADLPELTAELAQAFITRATELMRGQGWIEEIRKPNGVNLQLGAHQPGAGDFAALYGSREEKYAAAALQGCCDELAAMPQNSGRNDRLNALAFRLGTMSARQWISRDEVAGRLFEAAAACLLVNDDGEVAARATIKSGQSSGELVPHKDLDGNAEQPDQGSAEPLAFIDMSEWDARPAPPRQWSVRDRIPLRQPALLSGEGSVGKTLLSLQLGIATVLGRDWLGMLPEPGPVIYLGCEDDDTEIHRRVADIAAHYHASFADLIEGGLHLLSFAGKDAILGAANRAGIIEPTPLFDRILKAACEIQPRTLVIDTSADTFAGNENDRQQVRQFVGLLRRLAMDGNCSVLLCSHPSLTGISTGTGLSGSTGWHNSVRARMFFRTAKTEQDDEPDPELRELLFLKNNYGPLGERVLLRWKAGVFVPEPRQGTLQKAAAEQTAERLFVALLCRFNDQGRNVSEKPASKNYAPTVFGKEAEAKKHGVRKGDFEGAMRRLFETSAISVENYGSPCRGTMRLVTR